MGWALPLLLAACHGPGDPTPTDGASLDPVAHLVRTSVAVRGVRPTVEEIEAVRADPTAYAALVDGWLASEEFGATIRDMWAEILLLRNDTFNQLPALGLLEGYLLDDIFQSTVEEPLALVEYVVEHDRPFTEIVTADYMLTDDVVALAYGVPYDFDVGGWQVSRWPDDRPLAGLLSSAQVWRRWESDGSNFNRGRANMLAGQLLCAPFETRDVQAIEGLNIADEDEVADAVMELDGCVSCHVSLDPLAGYFWGYKQLVHRNYVADSITGGCEFDWSGEAYPEFGTSYLPEDYCYPIRQYNPADEDNWADWGLRPPSWFGHPARDLAEVGRLVAADPRFSSCMARQFYGYLTQTDVHDVPYDTAVRLQHVFEDANFDAKTLVRAIVTDPGFRSVEGGLDTVRPEQYARIVEDLTGYRWWAVGDLQSCDDPGNEDVQRFGTQCWGDVDLSDSDVFGFRAMAGGVDGKVVLVPTRTVTPTKTLVMARLAADAAGFAVDADFRLPAGSRKLLRLVEPGTADGPQVRDQLAWLHLRVLGEDVSPDGPEVAADLALFELGQAERGEPSGGWEVVLTALLQDPRLLFY